MRSRRRARRAAFALISFLAEELAIEKSLDKGTKEKWLGGEEENKRMRRNRVACEGAGFMTGWSISG